MSDIMRPIPFGELMNWVLEEYRTEGTIFGVNELYRHTSGKTLPIFTEQVETPFGPAAGPHTQLAQNLIAAYVGGSRFFEVKTVQIIDGEDLPVAKPCIKAEDECYVVTQHYSTPMTDHAFMEPECAIGIPDGDGGLLMYTGSQSVYDEQKEISRMLKLPPEKVRCQTKLVGGGFGGKEDMSVQHHAALMAWATGKPVKVKFSRQESLNIHTKRHAMEMDVTTACDKDGKLVAMKALLISDCGAYASLGGPVLQRACTHAGGPYNFQNVDITGICVYTNNVPGGAFRGFGVTQSCFAGEVNLDLLAEKVGISPWEIRYRNAIRPGQVLPNGQIASPDTGYAECLEAVKEAFESSPYAGIAGCMKNSGVGVGLPDIGRCRLAVVDGVVHIRTSAACMGQGVATVCTQLVHEVTGVAPQQMSVRTRRSRRTPARPQPAVRRCSAARPRAVRRSSSTKRSRL